MWAESYWKDYELLDTSDGQRLERWADQILIRPDPQVVWGNVRRHAAWKKADATYSRSKKGGGAWSQNTLPPQWTVRYDLMGEIPVQFLIRPMGFKHTGLFPEQAVNWDWCARKIKAANRPIKLLNLFAYTGAASICAAAAGASVCHVDAAKGMVAQAKENAALSGLEKAPIRYIVDDCRKFVEREIRRGNRYDAIIMDPPSYGRGPGGEMWKLEENIFEFVTLCTKVLSDKPLFVLINSYTTGLSASTVKYVLEQAMPKTYGGHFSADEVGLPVTQTGGVLPCGAGARWWAE